MQNLCSIQRERPGLTGTPLPAKLLSDSELCDLWGAAGTYALGSGSSLSNGVEVQVLSRAKKALWGKDLGHRESGAFFWGEDGRVEFRGAELRVEGRAFDQTHGIDANWNVAGFPDWRRLHIDGCRRDSHTTVSGIPGAVHFTG